MNDPKEKARERIEDAVLYALEAEMTVAEIVAEVEYVAENADD